MSKELIRVLCFIQCLIFSSTIHTDAGSTLAEPTATTSKQLVRQVSQVNRFGRNSIGKECSINQSEPTPHPKREELAKQKFLDSFDDDETDPEKRKQDVNESFLNC